MTAIDYSTRYVVAEAVPNRNAKTVAKFIFRLMLRFGAPEEIITDRASVFTGDVLKEYLAIHDTLHLPSSPYHPQTNGLCERVHGTLGAIITKMTEGCPPKWDEFLPAAVFIVNARTHQTTGFSPFSLVYGFQPRLPGDIFPPCIFSTQDPAEVAMLTRTELNRLGQSRALALAKSREQQRAHLASHSQPDRVFQVGDFVKLKNFTKKKFEFRWTGPFIIDRIGENNVYYLMKPNGDLLHHPYNAVHLAPWSQYDSSYRASGGGSNVGAQPN